MCLITLPFSIIQKSFTFSLQNECSSQIILPGCITAGCSVMARILHEIKLKSEGIESVSHKDKETAFLLYLFDTYLFKPYFSDLLLTVGIYLNLEDKGAICEVLVGIRQSRLFLEKLERCHSSLRSGRDWPNKQRLVSWKVSTDFFPAECRGVKKVVQVLFNKLFLPKRISMLTSFFFLCFSFLDVLLPSEKHCQIHDKSTVFLWLSSLKDLQ